MMMSRILLCCVAAAAGLKVKETINDGRLSLGSMQKMYGSARNALLEMHMTGSELQGGEAKTSLLVKTSKDALQEALFALGGELKNTKPGQIPSLKDWFKKNGHEQEYYDLLKMASLIPLDDEGDAVAKDISKGFANMLLETTAKIKDAGDSKKVSKEVLKSIVQKHSAGPQEKLKAFAQHHPSIDASLIALNSVSAESMKSVLAPIYDIPRNTNYDDFECGMVGKAMTLQGIDWCLGFFGTGVAQLSMNSTTNSALCVEKTGEYWGKTCENMGISVPKSSEEDAEERHASDGHTHLQWDK